MSGFGKVDLSVEFERDLFVELAHDPGGGTRLAAVTDIVAEAIVAKRRDLVEP